MSNLNKKLDFELENLENNYKNLSIEVSNETTSRIIENSKLNIMSLKETHDRKSGQEKLYKLINDNKDDINKLYLEFEKLKLKFGTRNESNVVEEYSKDNLEPVLSLPVKEYNKMDSAKSVDSTNELFENQKVLTKEKIKVTENKIIDNMNKLQVLLNEKANNKKPEEIFELDRKINVIKSIVDELNIVNSKQNKELDNIIKSKEGFEIAKNIESIKEYSTDYQSDFDNYYKLIKEFDSLSKICVKINQDSKDYINKLEKLENYSKFEKDIKSIERKLLTEVYNLDILNLFSSKIKSTCEELINGVKNVDYSRLKTQDELSKFKQNFIKTKNTLKVNCDEISKKIIDASELQKEFINIFNLIETIHSNIEDKPMEEVTKDSFEVLESSNNKFISKMIVYERNYRESKYESLNLPDKTINAEDMITDEIAINIFKNNAPNTDKSDNIKISYLEVEDADTKGNIINNKIGKVISKDYKINDIKVEGPGMKSIMVFTDNEEPIYKNITFDQIKKSDLELDIIEKSLAIKIAQKSYGLKKCNLKAELCYYSNSESKYIVPAYKITGTHNDYNLLDTFVSASLDLMPFVKIKNVEIESKNTSNSDYSFKSSFNIRDEDMTGSSFEVPNKLDFLVKVDIDKIDEFESINVISTFDIVDNIKSDNSFIVSLPQKITKKFSERLSKINVILYIKNKYGFFNQSMIVMDLSKYLDKFNVISLTSYHGGNRHNYGIEWGEPTLGGITYNRFIEEMNSYGVYKEYSFDALESKEKHFKDVNNSGKDDYFVDNVDISAYIGHGNGDGIKFETLDDDNTLSSIDAIGGKSWGNRDLEFQILMSCKVLSKEYKGISWFDRWGPSFNGLHLLCGFHSNVNVSNHNMLKLFVSNMYRNKLSVVESWLNAALDDQPEGYVPVVIGPLIKSPNKVAFNSIESSIEKNQRLHRAHWNDKTWGVDNGPGIDISKSDICGWWRISIKT